MAARTVPARPDRYEATAAPNGSRRLAVPAGAAGGDGAAGERARAERVGGDGAGDVTLSRAPAGEPAAVPGVWAGRPEPVAASPATVPTAMTAQAPSTTSTTRTGARGALAPECPECPGPACLPFAPDTDVLTTIPIASLGRVRSQRSQPPAGG